MFGPGDIVVYRHHVSEVAAIREAYFEGRDYYELHALFENRLKLFVAVDEAQASDPRPIMSRQEALALIDSMEDADPIDEKDIVEDAPTPTLRGRRMREEYDRLIKAGAPEELIPIMKSVHEHAVAREKTGRQITAVDKKYYDLAERALFDELAVSLGIDREDVGAFVEARIRSKKLSHGCARGAKGARKGTAGDCAGDITQAQADSMRARAIEGIKARFSKR